MRWRRRVGGALLMLALVALAACGGDDGDDDDETGAIRDAAERIVTTTDEVVSCGELMTTSFVRRIYRDLRRCRRAERPDADLRPPTDAQASVLSARDDEASVRVRIIGGDTDGAAGTILLRDVSGQWRLDGIRPDLVNALLAAGLREGFGDDIPGGAVACVIRRLRSSIGAGDEFVRMIVADTDRTGEKLVRALFTCRPSEVRELFESSVRDAIGDDLPDDLTDCIIRRLRSSVDDDELLMLLRERPAAERAGERAARACVAGRGESEPSTRAS